MNAATFSNPILPGFHPDPSICRVGEDFFLVTSSFAYFPGIPLFHSRDLVNWTQLGHVLTRESQLPLNGATRDFGFLGSCLNSLGIWAPTIRHWRGRFYVISTNMSHGGHFLVSAADPRGPWSDPVWIDALGIDPSLHFEHDRAYFLSNEWPHGRTGLVMAEIDLATGRLRETPRLLWGGSGAKSPEGPHLYKRGEHYYLLSAEGGTEAGHLVAIARSRSLWGPYEPCPHNPILSHRSFDHPIQSTGHGDFVEAADGSWWIVFLGTRPVGYPGCHVLGRETFLAPVSWAEDWPRIDLPVPLTQPLRPWMRPARTADDFLEDFSFARFGCRWTWLRNPDPSAYTLRGGSDGLVMRCSPRDLTERLESPSFVGIRQTAVGFVATATLALDQLAPGDEAGIVVYQSENAHFSLGVKREPDRLTLITTRRIIGLTETKRHLTPVPPVATLAISCDGRDYQAHLGSDSAALAGHSLRLLATELAGGFTGVFIALYATAHGRSDGGSARFTQFRCSSYQ